MDGAEMKRGKGHKRKALDAGIQNQKAESAAPGSAEVRVLEELLLHPWCLPVSNVDERATRRDPVRLVVEKPQSRDIVNIISLRYPSVDIRRISSLQQRAGGVKAEAKHEDGSSVEEKRELLEKHMRALRERALQTGSHMECIIGAGMVLGAIVPLLKVDARFVVLHLSIRCPGLSSTTSRTLLPFPPQLFIAHKVSTATDVD